MLRETAFRRCPVAPMTLLSCRISLSSAHEPCSRNAANVTRRYNGAGIYSGCSSGPGANPFRQPVANHRPAECGQGVQTPITNRSVAQQLSRAQTSSSNSHASHNNYSSLVSLLEQSQPRTPALLRRCSRTVALSSQRSPSAVLGHPLSLPQALVKQGVAASVPRVFSAVTAIALSGAAVHATATPASGEEKKHRPSTQQPSSPVPVKPLVPSSVSATPAPVASSACTSTVAEGSPQSGLQFTNCQSGTGDHQPEKKKPDKSKDPEVLRVSKADATDLAGVLDRLQTELPDIFKDKRKNHFSLYDNDVILENTMYPCDYKTRGLSLFRTQAALLQAKWSLMCRDLEFHLLSCEKLPEESSIVIRWKIVGCPRWLPNKMASPERLRYLDGVTMFEVNGLGRVRRVKVSKLRRDGEHRFARTMPVMGLMALGLAGLKKEFCETFFRAFRR